MKDILIKKFYKNKNNLEKVVAIINRDTSYSRRILEWFCSNYSKKHNTTYDLNGDKNFNVYQSYKAQLNSFQKKQFDPFKRKHDGYGEFPLEWTSESGEKRKIITTVGQLNFFKWCIDKKILDYVENNIDNIKKDMKKTLQHRDYPSKKKPETIVLDKKTGDRKKRQPLSPSTARTCVKRFSRVTLEFK